MIVSAPADIEIERDGKVVRLIFTYAGVTAARAAYIKATKEYANGALNIRIVTPTTKD